MSENAILEAKNLTKTFGTVRALDDVSFRLAPGHIVGLLGPNGSGKTTLIKTICGLLTPTSGGILVDGQKPDVLTKRMVSYLPDQTYLNETMTPEQTIRMFQDFYPDFSPGRAVQMMEQLGVARSRPIRTLSKGNKEKVQLILVMSRRARLFVLDEPIGGVDPATRDYILRTILNNYEEDATILISTHLVSDVEQILDEVLMLNQGRLVMQAEVDDIRQERGMSVDETFREIFQW